MSTWEPRLRARGAGLLETLSPALRRADPDQLIAPRSAALCCALAELALCTYRALGGRAHEEAVAEAAALLALLTKLDDQIIDSLSFHGGASTPRAQLAERTRAFLAPTLEAIVAATPPEPSPRCDLAASLGQRLRALCDGRPERLDDIVAQITRGWAIQVEAVVCLSADPATIVAERVDEVTASISGAWLMMIAAIGTLPSDAARLFDTGERAAFWRWGRWIQRADALADYDKDLADAHLSSWPNHAMASRRPAAWRAAYAAQDVDALMALLAETDADLTCLPCDHDLDALDEALSALGELSQLMSWIQGFLLGRYLRHPACRRACSQAPWSRYDTAMYRPHVRQKEEDADVRHPAT